MNEKEIAEKVDDMINEIKCVEPDLSYVGENVIRNKLAQCLRENKK